MSQLSQSDVDQVVALNRLFREVSSVDEIRREALQRMETMFNASSSMFLLRPEGARIATFDRYVVHGLPDEFPRIYPYGGIANDPFAHALLSRPGIELRQEVLTADELVPYEKLINLPFYWQYMRRYGIFHMLRIELVVNGRSIATAGLFRPEGEENFTATDIVKATLVSSSLATALDRELCKERYNEDISILQNSTSCMSHMGFFIMDANMELVYCDANASRICDMLSSGRRRGYEIAGLPSRIFEPIASYSNRLQGGACSKEAETSFTVYDDDGKQPINVHVRPHRTIYDRFRFLVFLSPEVQNNCSVNHLTNLGISKREAEIAQLVVSGLRNYDIADKLSISLNTVQSHLNKIFRKLNVQNRAELIAKVTRPLTPETMRWIQ